MSDATDQGEPTDTKELVLGVDHIADLPMPSVAEWPIFPFKGDIHVRTVQPFRGEEHLRHGDPGGPPCECQLDEKDQEREMRTVWTDGRWKVARLHFNEGELSPFPAYMLSTVDHMDFEDFDEALGAELGVMSVRIEKAIRAIGDIGRVHINRWGDGGAHFHVWFLGRPKGAWQLSGYNLPMWGFILPSLDADVHERNDRVVADHLAEAAAAAG